MASNNGNVDVDSSDVIAPEENHPYHYGEFNDNIDDEIEEHLLPDFEKGDFPNQCRGEKVYFGYPLSKIKETARRIILPLLAFALVCVFVSGVWLNVPFIGNKESAATKQVLASMDFEQDPCEDFYMYVCGGWDEKAKIKKDRGSASLSFETVSDRVTAKLENILDAEGESPKTKPGIFYRACTFSFTQTTKELYHLETFMGSIATITDSEMAMKVLSKLHKAGINLLFDMAIQSDVKDPSQNVIYLGQGGLGLPGRDYYVNQEKKDKQLRQQYQQFITEILDLAKGYLVNDVPVIDDAEQGAKDILEFETKLATISLPAASMRDPEKTYNKRHLDDTPRNLHLQQYFVGLGLDVAYIQSSAGIVLDNINFFTQLEGILESSSPKLIISYFTYHTTISLAGAGILGKEPLAKKFEYDLLVYGRQKPDNKKWCFDVTNYYFGEAMGKLFVDAMFTEQDKLKADEFVNTIEESFSEEIEQNTWMDKETQKEALLKLRAIKWKIGYPNKNYTDAYSDVIVDIKDFPAAVFSSREHMVQKTLNKLGKPVDKAEWYMNPQDVNAYYDPSQNEMVFPAGILQQPFFSRQYAAAINYGGIGSVMGHELTHGFDDEGRKFDGNGVMADWWTKSAGSSFEERASCVVEYYNKLPLKSLPGAHVNGRLTLGENLADMGGLKVSYRAFKNALVKSNGTEIPIGLTKFFSDEQVFFIAYGQNWCSKYKENTLRALIRTNPHSPGELRVLGPLSNFPEFGQAFNCPLGSRYNPSSKCVVW